MKFTYIPISIRGGVLQGVDTFDHDLQGALAHNAAIYIYRGTRSKKMAQSFFLWDE